MKIRHQDLEILEDNPFENCKLDRKQYALILTEIVSIYADGFVLAINNEWGTGKTTFVKMWQSHLIRNEFETIYFNAWENDFDTNPLVAIMSELKNINHSENTEIFNSVIEKGAILTKNILPGIVKAIASKYIDIQVLADVLENVATGASLILEEEIKEFANKKKTIIEFRKDLQTYINKINADKPLIFIIDELDRCRPNYAVEVLEQMKHFFSVRGIVFVLSIDKNHLASAVKGFYNSENINTNEYLRRFIDLEYSIPRPSNKIFCEYLFHYYSFNEFFSIPSKIKNSDYPSEAKSLLNMAEVLFNRSNATLRQQEKIFGHTRLILGSLRSNQKTFSHLLFALIFIKFFKEDLYIKIENNQLSLQELSDAFASFFPDNFSDFYSINLVFVEALLLFFYNNNHNYPRKLDLFETDAEGKFSMYVHSKLEEMGSKIKLWECLKIIEKENGYSGLNLTKILCKINLTEPLLIQKQK